jgi:hypothetical protein
MEDFGDLAGSPSGPAGQICDKSPRPAQQALGAYLMGGFHVLAVDTPAVSDHHAGCDLSRELCDCFVQDGEAHRTTGDRPYRATWAIVRPEFHGGLLANHT